jgi:hypothetical protein
MLKKLLNFILPNKSESVNAIFVKFKTNRIAKEFKELYNKNNDLHELAVDLSHFIKSTFNKELVITMIYRTDQEQDDIYKNDPKYKVKKFKSPHQFWQAIDVRSSIFDKLEISKIEDYLNKKHNSTNYYSWTARCHTVPGQAYHFHLQFVKK